MKKLTFLFALLFASAFVFSACGQNPGSDASVSGSEFLPPMVGAYGDEREPTEEDLAIFNKAIAELPNKNNYTPLGVSTQVVAGLNFRFHVEVKDGDETYEAYVYIFLPLGDDAVPEISKEERI